MLPKTVIESGLLAHMLWSDAKVYVVIAAYVADDQHPSLTKICGMAGLRRSTVCVALQRLRDLGAIDVDRGSGARCNHYTIKPNPCVAIHVETTDELDLPEVAVDSGQNGEPDE